MPAKSKSQQRLMAAAEHGATFPKAKAIQQSMTIAQMTDFARGFDEGQARACEASEDARGPSPRQPGHVSASEEGAMIFLWGLCSTAVFAGMCAASAMLSVYNSPLWMLAVVIFAWSTFMCGRETVNTPLNASY